jgi:hypothetical protein
VLFLLFVAALPLEVRSLQPLTSYTSTPGLSLFSAPASKAYLMPLLKAFGEKREAPTCGEISATLDVAALLTELATHPDGHERDIRVLTALGLADADRLTVCVTPTKTGVDVRGSLRVRRWTGLLASVGAPTLTSLRAAKDRYWGGAVSLVWPSAFSAVKQLDKAMANTRGSRLDAALQASGTLLDVNLERAFVEPLTGHFEVDMPVDAATKRVGFRATAAARSTSDAVRAMAIVDETLPDAGFNRPKQKNEWSFIGGTDSVYVQLSDNEMRAANDAFALTAPVETLKSSDGPKSALWFVDVGRFRKLYERVGGVEDTKRLVRDLKLSAYVDASKTPAPKVLFAGIERCEIALERKTSELAFLVRCSR